MIDADRMTMMYDCLMEFPTLMKGHKKSNPVWMN